MRNICISLAAGILFLCLSGCKTRDTSGITHPEPEQKPNIVYVLADQWRAQATGYNGDPNLIGKTPNLDRMADQGIHFRNAISVCPVCTPYRAALLTGKFPTTTGMFFNDLQLPPESLTMAKLFKESGYRTCYIGKWHLDGMGRDQFTPPERRQGFDYWKALECSHDYQQLYYYEGDSDERKVWEGYGPYAETEDAIRYIRDNAGNEEPFLMVLAWGAPHFPHHNAPEDLLQHFRPEDIILRENVSEAMKESARKESAGYYAHILALDSCMGMLQKAMDESGISHNTIFVFTSDHGEMMGSQDIRPKQKQVPWAESVRIPFLLSYPAKYGNRGIIVDVPLNTPDILPTLLSLSNVPVPDNIEGENMAGAIENREAFADRAALFMNVSHFAGEGKEYRGIYTDRYCYVKSLEGPWLLYDHQKDPLQMDNLAGKPGFESLQEEMERMLQRELEKVDDPFMPRQYYIDKWAYRLGEGGYIPYYFQDDLSSGESRGIEFQGPELNKKYRKE
ncbi:MAG: sulfatase [Bacteroidetes bacterium]|nr:MAG: sulfatase [Bacteroidota bacterium]RLD71566.1 MAG: sulfatase [Bacteroidota bacterium]RLE05104.1 MAG: sulfatase [Bacteroidota bacterium]